jgi:predicted  nucleic acid-binding Zn-ribbon protein
MSDSVRPEVLAFRDLQLLVRQLGDELADFRRRALTAESQLDALAGDGGRPEPRLRLRLDELEQENATLRRQLEAATERTRSMLDRVHFLRQQLQGEQR